MNGKDLISLGKNFLYRRPLYDLNSIGQSEKFSDPVFQKAVYFSSPEFYHFLQNVSVLTNRMNRTLKEYLARMSTRPVPFGLFSGIGEGTFRKSEHRNPNHEDNKTSLGLSFNVNFSFYREQLFNTLYKDLNFILAQTYSINCTLYKIGDEYRYIERVFVSKEFDDYQYSGFPVNEPVKLVLALCDSGNTGEQIIDELISTGFAETFEEAFDFITELIQNDVIQFGLNYVMLDTRHYVKIAESHLNHNHNDTGLFKSIYSLVQKEHEFQSIEEANEFLEKKIFTSPSLFDRNNEIARYIDVNLFFKKQLEIDEKIKKKLKTAFLGLVALAKNTRRNHYLDEFKKKFFDKYEHQKVQLLQAIDPEIGVGFGVYNYVHITKTEFVDFSSFLYQNSQKEFKYENSKRISKYEDTIRILSKELELSNEKLELLPASCSICFELLQSANPEMPYIRVIAAGGTSGLNLLSRFYKREQESFLEKFLQEIVDFELEVEDCDLLRAEISYLPRLISGSSILNRENFFDYEIPIFNSSSKDSSATVRLSDLYVHINLSGELILSNKQGKKVVPRNSSAHDFMEYSNPIYQFLSVCLQTKLDT